MELIDDFMRLVVDSKLLAAKSLYDKIIAYVSACEDSVELGLLQTKIENLSDIIGQLHYRLTEIHAAMAASAASEELDESWLLGLTYLGITTHYKNNPDGTISVRLSGIVDELAFFEQIAVIHEFDLFQEWFPFCCNSKTITKLGPAELVGYLQTYIAPLGRDVVLRAYGADCLTEHNKLVLIGSSVTDWPPRDPRDVIASAQIFDYARRHNLGFASTSNTNNSSSSLTGSASTTSTVSPGTTTRSDTTFADDDDEDDWFQSIVGKPVPWVDIGWLHDRVDIREFKAVVEVVSPQAAKTIFLITCNPRANLPQKFINFIIRNLAGMFMHFFQTKVKKVAADPESSHGQRVRANPEFYVKWLLPKLREYCDLRGWDQPAIVCLGADGLPSTTTNNHNSNTVDTPANSLG